MKTFSNQNEYKITGSWLYFHSQSGKRSDMSRILKKVTHSICLGNEENGTPKLGIFIDAEESWCSKLYIDRKICENIEKWDSEWDKFIDASGHEEIRSSFCNYPYKKIYEKVIFDTKNNKLIVQNESEKDDNQTSKFYVVWNPKMTELSFCQVMSKENLRGDNL